MAALTTLGKEDQLLSAAEERVETLFAIRRRLGVILHALDDAHDDAIDQAVKASSELPELLTQYARLPGTKSSRRWETLGMNGTG